MEYTLQERTIKIIECCKKTNSINPIQIFEDIASKDFIRIHGPEHHILDGAVILTAFYNTGGNIDLDTSLNELMSRGLQMPGAICGKWGVCGAVSSIGAALSIIDETGPLTTDSSWGSHMEYTSMALHDLSLIGGPRCCKRDAYSAIKRAICYISDNYGVTLGNEKTACKFAVHNKQCIGVRCPFSVG